jgi:hypothetical protein
MGRRDAKGLDMRRGREQCSSFTRGGAMTTALMSSETPQIEVVNEQYTFLFFFL